MKKIFCSIALLTLALSASFATAQLTATSKPVVLKAIVPEYIGLTPLNTAPVVFNFKLTDEATKEQFVRGAALDNFTGSNAPSWELTYNLKHRTVSVCAYATDLINGGEANSKIPAVLILGVPLQFTGGNGRWFGAEAGCQAGVAANAVGIGGGAILMDKIMDATSSFNTEATHVRLEGFSLMQIAGNPGNDWRFPVAVPAPGVYLGTMYIVAQAI